MKKTITILAACILVIAIAYVFSMNRKELNVPQTEGVAVENIDGEAFSVEEREVSGTVVSVNTDQVPVDGPALVTIREESGTQAVIAIRSMGINLCPAQANIANPYELKSGDKVEARGQIGEESMIIPCESDAHYLRTVGQ